jgi:hypothetical protein
MILPTYSLIKVKEIRHNAYVLENGGLRAVIKVNGINLFLMNDEEQDVVINQFKSFLDGLDFPVEILVISRAENLTNYLKILHLRSEEEKDPLIKFQLEEFISFLEDFLQNHNVMKKIFYVIVPYDTLEVSFLKKSKEKVVESDETKFSQLETRVAYLLDSLHSLGLSPQRLSEAELIELLFEVYNPNLKWSQLPKQVIEKLKETL